METNKPQITTAEVQDWENKFKESVSPLVKFDNDGTANGSLKLYNGKSGVEAIWSGVIILNNDNYIKWNFSIQNEPFIDCKLNYNENNYTILINLKNFYDSWKTEWSKQLTMPDSAMTDDNNSNPTGQEQPSEPNAAMPAPQLQENKRTKMNIINNHKERMQKLSGLR